MTNLSSYSHAAAETSVQPNDWPTRVRHEPASISATDDRAAVTAGAKRIHTTILIPAYNEEEALPHVLDDILSVVDETYEVLIVDDGSKDGTRIVADSYTAAHPNCRVISHKVNRGKGAAMQTGIRQAHGDNIIFIDGDATYPASAIPEVVRDMNKYDVVRCVRSDGRDNIPFINRLGNQFFDQVIKHVHKVDGSDMLSGLYGLKKKHLMAMRLTAVGFDIESEIMIKAQKMHLKAHNIPIQYNERIGEKKLNPALDGMKILVRIVFLALMLNPFVTYVLPGLLLWLLAIGALVLLGQGPIFTPFAGFTTHTIIVSAMTFLAGFQLVVFGCAVNMYVAETGLGKPSRALSAIATRIPRLSGLVTGAGLIGVGAVWSATMVYAWAVGGFSPFRNTEALVIALSLVVWGIQIMSMALFLSLFAGSSKFGKGQSHHVEQH
jgi:hypothetical protein